MIVDPRDRQAIEQSGLFDAGWYRERYPDVELLEIDPIEHYLVIGATLSRDPGPRFSTRAYFEANPELARSGLNPLLHCLRPPHDADFATSRYAIGLPGLTLTTFVHVTDEQADTIRKKFDADFYLRNHPEVAEALIDPFTHYMVIGWKRGWDPTPTFSTDYYLRMYPDIRSAGMNPFAHWVMHGHREMRATRSYRAWLDDVPYQPRVTAIVPNYNHARFLRQRIDSILGQTYQKVQLLLLDDASSDNSREVVSEYVERYPQRVTAVFNETNSGNVFRQWRKGVEIADGELVWICESDDFCEVDFLEALVPHFKDDSVNLAFGKIQFSDVDGALQEGLDQYREGAEAGIWDEAMVRPAAQWFAGGFGVNNVIANVGGSVWRNQRLAESVWEVAQSFEILGDWFLYSRLAGGGQIAYDPMAVAYFRQHGANTSVASFRTAGYYVEHERLMTKLRERWPIPRETVDAFISKVSFQYAHAGLDQDHGPVQAFLDAERLLPVERQVPHVLIAFLGFHSGGGELFPINLANSLHDSGWEVSMMALDIMDENPDVKSLLKPGIPVYCVQQVEEFGVEEFVSRCGVSIIHTHMSSLDYFFIEKHGLSASVPYLVSLHGSYEASGMTAERIHRLADRVDHWVYTADKNLLPFASVDLPPERFSKLANGLSQDDRPFPKTRAELGVQEDALVFTFAARGVPGKGWFTAPEVFRRFRDSHPERSMHLFMVGNGEEADVSERVHGDDPDISFLGFVSQLSGLYRMSDCALVPTRFPGESQPLCVIQAMQARVPVIATRIGEIDVMLAPEGRTPCGLLVDYDDNDERFEESLLAALETFLDPDLQEAMQAASLENGSRYDMGSVTASYSALYTRLLAQAADSEGSDN